jgi:DUF1365 family protein
VVKLARHQGAKPVLYRSRIAHGRTERVAHGFSYRHPTWLVDLDAVPNLPRGLRTLGAFDARDHFGDPRASIRTNVEGYLAGQGVEVAGGRVLMLANARSFGYTFNPLSVFWCYDRDDILVGVIAEVHNTYGERHCYLLRPDADGRAGTAKEFYVSPFFAVDGHYEMRFTDPRAIGELRVEITLSRDHLTVFRASLTGRADTAAPSFLRGALRHPFGGQRVMALIKLQGIRLWLRRLPVVPRPAAPVQEGVQA